MEKVLGGGARATAWGAAVIRTSVQRELESNQPESEGGRPTVSGGATMGTRAATGARAAAVATEDMEGRQVNAGDGRATERGALW